MREKLGLIIFLLLMFCVPFVYLLNNVILELLLIISCLVVFSFTFMVRNKHGASEVPSLEMGGLLLLYVLLQMVPLPPFFLKWLSPLHAELYAQTLWIVDPETWAPISMNTRETIILSIRMLTLGVVYLITIQVVSDRDNYNASLFSIAFLTCIAATYTMLTVMTMRGGGGSMVPALISDNNNTFFVNTTWQALGAIVVFLPIIWATYLIARISLKGLLKKEDARRYLSWHLRYRLVFLKAVICLAIAAVIFIGSLGGMLVSLLSGLVATMLVAAQRHPKVKSLLLVGLFVVISVSTYLLNALHLKDVFLWNTYWQEGIHNKHSSGLDNPSTIFGFGLGSFDNVHNYFLGAAKDCTLTDFCVPHALQFFNDTGIIGIILLLGFHYSLIRYTNPAWTKRNRSSVIYLYTGSLSGLITLFVAGIAGPGLDLVNAMYLFVILSALIVITQSLHVPTGNNRQSVQLMPEATYRILCISVFFLMTPAIILQSSEVMGKLSSGKVIEASERQVGENSGQEMLRQASEAVAYAPLNSDLRIVMADLNFAAGNINEAINQYYKGLRITPLSGRALSRLSLAYELSGEQEKAVGLLDAANKLSFHVDDYHRGLLLKLLKAENKEAAMRQIRLAISQEPYKTGEYIGILRLHNQDLENFEAFLPRMWAPYLIMGDYMLSADNREAAEKSYRLATSYALESSRLDAKPFIRVIKYFLEEENNDEALKLSAISTEVIPDNAELHYLMAVSYEKKGIVYRALEEYRVALLLNPGHAEAYERLQYLQDVNKH